MPFQHCCFLSYRGIKSAIAERFVNDLYHALENEPLTLVPVDEPVYMDRKRLTGPDLLDGSLAWALCHSACMVIVYTPVYFDSQKTYCAREFRAMLSLEHHRLSQLPAARRFTGLIFSIILRGDAKSLPSEITKRHWYDFGSYLLIEQPLTQNPKYADQIRTIANDIRLRYALLSSIQPDCCAGCAQFSLPSEDDVLEWLNIPLVAEGPGDGGISTAHVGDTAEPYPLDA